MNTRVFKDISKYQHRAWLGFTTRQIIFVLPAFIVTIIVLGLNLFFWQFGDWFVYGFEYYYKTVDANLLTETLKKIS